MSINITTYSCTECGPTGASPCKHYRAYLDAIAARECESSPMSDERLAEIEAEHQPDPWMKEHRGVLWCGSPDCNQDDVTGAIHVDWPCDAAQLVAEVRRLRRALALSEASRGTPSVGALPEITDRLTHQKYRFERGTWQKVTPSVVGQH